MPIGWRRDGDSGPAVMCLVQEGLTTYLRLEGLAFRVEREVDGRRVGTGPFIL